MTNLAKEVARLCDAHARTVSSRRSHHIATALAGPSSTGKYEALSQPLKARIDRFRVEAADFRIQSEAYEMVACVDADLIANALRSEVEAGRTPYEVVERFAGLSWEAQRTKVPSLNSGHSGNTFGWACNLARCLLEGIPV